MDVINAAKERSLNILRVRVSVNSKLTEFLPGGILSFIKPFLSRSTSHGLPFKEARHPGYQNVFTFTVTGVLALISKTLLEKSHFCTCMSPSPSEMYTFPSSLPGILPACLSTYSTYLRETYMGICSGTPHLILTLAGLYS